MLPGRRSKGFGSGMAVADKTLKEFKECNHCLQHDMAITNGAGKIQIVHQEPYTKTEDL